MKPPPDIDKIRAECDFYFNGRVPRDASDWERMVGIPLRKRLFEAKAKDYVRVLLKHIGKQK